MLRLFRHTHRRQVLHLLALLTGLSSGVVRAKMSANSADAVLAATMVDLGADAGRSVSLAEIFSLVESETELKFTYSAGEFPLGTQVALAEEKSMSLARLFALVSAQNDIVFEHRDGRVAVRARDPEDAVEKASHVESSERADALAVEVNAIVEDTRLSRAKKEKQISLAVRSAIVAATSAYEDADEILAVAVDLTDNAAKAGPRFVEVIANAAAFAPPVAGIRGGRAQVRAAAYAGAEAPTKGSPRVSIADEPPGRAFVVKAPRGQNPDTFLASSYTPSDSAPAESVEERSSEGTSTDPLSSVSAEPVAASSSADSFQPGLPAITAAPIETTTPQGSVDKDGVITLEKYSVSGTVTRGSTSDLRSERAKAAVALDFMSADQIAKYSAADLSDVVFRMPGVSVVNGQFAVVRGLSDRFLSTTLQGIKLPTPDPEKQAVQLDLIPASAVEAVVVSKTFQSSMWAESSGGNMDVRTRAIPTESLLKLSFGLKMNSNAADGGPDYAIRGAKDERLGFGSRSRLAFGTADKTWEYTPTHRNSFPMGNKVSAEFARAFSFGDQQLGVIVNAFSEAGYKAKAGRKQASLVRGGRRSTPVIPATPTSPAVAADPGIPGDFEIGLPTAKGILYDYEESESENILSATTAIGYRFSLDHELKFTGLFVQSGIDQVQVNGTPVFIDPVTKLPKTIAGPTGFAGAEDNAWYKTYEYFRERNLAVLQLSGQHEFPALGDLKANWGAQRGTSYQKESPFIEANFATPLANLNKVYSVIGGSDSPQSLKVLWADNDETQQSARLDVDWPFRLWGEQDSLLSFGGAFDSTQRQSSGTSIDYSLRSENSVTDVTPNAAFSRALNPNLGGIATPAAGAERQVRAYYTGANLALVGKLKLVAGARYEDFTLATSGSGRWGGNLTSANFYGNYPAKALLGFGATNSSRFESKKWYPGTGLVFGPWNSLTVRVHYSKTTGRPSLREVSPFFNKSIETDNIVVGNPALRPSDVTNYDVKIEWSPTKTDFLAFSVFRKDIENPIEKMLFTQTTASAGEVTESWVNNPSQASVKGFEFEFRHELKSWSRSLRAFSLSGNFTKLDATVGENPVVIQSLLGVFQDSTKIPVKRRLFDQPEFIANLDFTWTHAPWGTSATLAAFALSDVLVATGKPSSFDLYERAHARLDLIFNQQLAAHLKLKLTVKNLADPVRGLIYDRDATSELVERNTYRAGREFGVSVTADF